MSLVTTSLPHPLANFRPDPDDTAFLFDFDGTLVDIALLPEDVRVAEGLAAALAVLARLAGGAVGIISGRRIVELDRMLPGFDGPLAGVHGLEIRLGARGSAVITDRSGGEGLSRLRDELGPWLRRHPGLSVEDKGLAVAIHFRSRPEHAEEVEEFASQIVRDEPDLKIQRGKMVVEIRATGPGKGESVAAMMALPAFSGRRPLFFGDDVTDEAAFAAANALGGGGVFIGELTRPTFANYQLHDPADVSVLIHHIVGSAVAEQGTTG